VKQWRAASHVWICGSCLCRDDITWTHENQVPWLATTLSPRRASPNILTVDWAYAKGTLRARASRQNLRGVPGVPMHPRPLERFLAVSLRRKPLSQENWGLVSEDPIFGNPLNNDDYPQCWHPNKQTQQEHWLKMSIANVILRQAFAPRDACRQPGSRYLDGHSHIAVMKVLHDRRVGKSPMVPLQPRSWLTIPMKTCVFPAQVLHPHCTRLLHVYVHGQLKCDLYCYT